jgi:hypothetical protein
MHNGPPMACAGHAVRVGPLRKTYCEQNGLAYRVFEPALPKRIIQAYADNFAFTQRVPWTH